MLADQFTQIFRGEHRKIRDALLDLIAAFEERDKARVQSRLNQAAVLTGPHFRYEEEALYPALVEIYGEEYIEKLLGDHDTAIGTAKQLIELAGKDPLTDDDVAKATRFIRSILPHVSDCDGLSIMTEVLAEEKVSSTLDARERSLAEGLNLLEWADKVRDRPVVVPE
ncbi:MAG: hemerythrin domain-containing protein [Anaerolineae bacterium]